MDQVILYVLGVAVTPWKLVGYLGVMLFAGRWFVQLYYSRKHRRPVVPTVFWWMSISGSLLLLSYLYNLYLDLRNRRRFAPRGPDRASLARGI